jgi:protease PrsW
MPVYLLLLIFIVLGAALAWFLVGRDRGAKEPVGILWVAAGLGSLGAVAAGYAEGKLINPDHLLTGMPHGTIMAAAMAVGVIEEFCKFFPLALFIYKKPYFNEHTDGVIYFALAGLGFGLPENMLYTLQFGQEAGIPRLLLTPVFHAAITGLIGYYLIRGKIKGRPLLAVLPAFVVAVIAHGLYDFGLTSGVAAYAAVALSITLGLSIGLFLAYNQATDLDQDEGKSAMGHNDFCRACGYPNPRHYLYCVHCGKNA